MRLAVLVEVVVEDVGGDSWREEVEAGVASLEAMAEGGRGYVLVDILEEVDAGALAGSEVECGEVFEGEAGAADDDPFGEFEEAVGLAPVGKVQEAVGTDEVEEFGAGQEMLQGFEGVYGVVGGAIGAGGIEVGGGEAGIGQAGEGGHGEAVGERRWGAFGL